MYADLLSDTCVIQRRTVTPGMTDKETWAAVETVPCLKLTRSAVRGNVEKAKDATLLSSRFALPLACTVAIRDRVLHGGRVYPVIEVLTPRTPDGPHHKVAVCEAVAGSV